MKSLRRINSLSISETRWLAYATAGVASAFGLSSSAEAEIHYSGLVNIRMEGDNSVFLPLTNGASLNFTVTYFSYPYAYFRITGAQQGSALAGYSEFGTIQVLQKIEEGQPIRSCDNDNLERCPAEFGSVAGMPGRGCIMGLYIVGYFQSFFAKSGVIGFKFNVGNGTQYGWARIVGPEGSNHYRYKIKDYAWADTGERIVAGQCSSTELGSVSKTGSLGLLAFGSQGLEAWRRQRMQKSN